VPLRLRGKDAEGKAFEALTTSENVSLNGFLCACGANLSIDSIIDVYLVGSSEQLVGKSANRSVRIKEHGIFCFQRVRE
jgi:hypothetical protein